MANYNIDIAVALKGAKELLKLKKDVKAVNQEIRGFNKALAENANKFPQTINKLAQEVNKAKVALRNAAVGTNTFTRAGEVLIKTQSNKAEQLQLESTTKEEKNLSLTRKSARAGYKPRACSPNSSNPLGRKNTANP